MSVDSPKPDHVLLFGKEPNLLEIRAMVLRSVGMVVDIALDIGTLKARVTASHSMYGVVVCCYTATDAEYNEMIVIASQNRLALLRLERLLAPGVLIDRVFRLIRGGRA